MKRKEFCSLGIMSGTSIDGLDFSLIKSDGVKNVKIIKNKYYKFGRNIRNEIINLIEIFSLEKKFIRNEKFYEIDLKFINFVIRKIANFLSELKGKEKKIDLIGFHGNTIIHSPKNNISVQLGNPKILAKKIKIPVVANFRNKDIEYLGEGAPLVPVYHKAIFSKTGKNIAVVNIGGISNFTFLSGKTYFTASDIGPGNTLIDRVSFLKFRKYFDKNGLLASKGEVNHNLVKNWMKKKLFKKSNPKSFDTKNFKIRHFYQKKGISDLNYLRSLTYLTAKLISKIEIELKKKVDFWIFSGGGVKNLTLMNDIKNLVGNEKIFLSDELGFDSLFIESAAFGFISIRTLKRLPSAFPETTGCTKKNVCGEIFNP